jgi:cysteine-rich repeat protein
VPDADTAGDGYDTAWRARSLWGLALVVGVCAAACGEDEPVGGGPSSSGSGGGGSGGSGGVGAQDGGGTGGGGGAAPECGNGVPEQGEECDDGNLVALDGCEVGCTLSCVSDGSARDCSDENACNGLETCSVEHRCVAGTPLADGVDCGDGKVCVGQLCLQPSCGDGQAQGAEECDDGDVLDENGCDRSCRFSCVPGDAARDCTPEDSCQGPAACDAASHTCGARTPLADGVTCDVGGVEGYCKSGACKLALCGDGVPEPGEVCDDGNTNQLDGCKNDCTFSCTSSADCTDSNECTLDGCDLGSHVCSSAADPTRDGTDCQVVGVAGRCTSGKCVPLTCGDGDVDAGEQCDTAGASADGGCGADCRYACQQDADCSDSEPCSGVETCVAVTSGKRCEMGTPLAQYAECQADPRRICVQDVCRLSLCGDGVVDSGGGEQCEPPSTATCTSTCQRIVCGDGVIAGSEQCDDGNTNNLDGCDAGCRYEAVYRATAFAIMRGPAPSYCTPTTNRFGNAFSQTVVDLLRDRTKADIDAGAVNVLFQALDLDDLTGVSDPTLAIGLLGGELDPARAATWQAGAIDWWFLANPSSVDTAGRPARRLEPASIQARILTAGPSFAGLHLTFDGRATLLELQEMRIRARIDDPPAPDVPAPPPASLAAGLAVFRSFTANQTDLGICGNVTVRSLSTIRVPTDLTEGVTACSATCTNSRVYTACPAGEDPAPGKCHSLLDALVGGCKATSLCSPVMTPTQPDVGTGGNTPRTLVADSSGYVSLSQTETNLDGYSMYVQIAANRAHLTGVAP